MEPMLLPDGKPVSCRFTIYGDDCPAWAVGELTADEIVRWNQWAQDHPKSPIYLNQVFNHYYLCQPHMDLVRDQL